MYVGSVFTIQTNLDTDTLSFSSSKKKVATVSEDGVILAKKKGKATISVTYKNKTKKIKVTVKKAKGYTISKKSGTYTDSVSVKVKAKKGYTIYYTTGKKFKKSKKIAAKKSKTFTIKKDTLLRLYPVKATKKMSTSKLNKTQAKNALRADYQYCITKTAAPTPTPTAPVVTTPGPSEYEGDDALNDYVESTPDVYDENDLNVPSTATGTAISIPSEATGEKTEADDGSYSISKKNKLTIKKTGTYTLTSADAENQTVDGLIEVDLDDGQTGTVHLILQDFHLKYTGTSEIADDGLLFIKKNENVDKVIVTVLGSVSIMDTSATGVDDSGETTYPSAIISKKVPLTINGTGTLTASSVNGNGIKCTDTLKIVGTTVNVYGEDKDSPVGHNGVSGKTGVSIKDASLNIISTGDSLKTTLDDSDFEDLEEGSEEYVALSALGNIDIDGGNYTLVSTDGDGISAYRALRLNPATLNITTMNQANSTEDGSYKGIKAGVTIDIVATAGTITVDTSQTNKSTSQNSESNYAYADDAIHCNGCINIAGGTINLKSGDDGIHADTGLAISGGTITVSESYEGLESADISITGGTINVTARDDGLNAGGGNDSSSTQPGGFSDSFTDKDQNDSSANYQIIISGGTLTVSCEGDGIDSNGNIYFKGGTVTVNGPVSGGNAALDYGDRNCICEVSGGTLVAAGPSDMAVSPTSGSSQPVIQVTFSSKQTANSAITVKDSSNTTVLTATPTKQFQTATLSCMDLELGKTYTVSCGSESYSVTLTSTVVTAGSSSQSNRPGGR